MIQKEILMSAFDKSTRRKIFYAMAALFAIVVPLALLYSRGYVVDLKRRGFVATGGIFVKTVQSGAKVYIDDEFSKETSFLLHGALVTNLIPRRYTVRVEKEGYQPWQKVVRVANGEVLEFRNVLLPPVGASPSAIFSGRRNVQNRVFPLAGRPELAVESGAAGKPISLFIVHPGTKAVLGEIVRVSQWSWDEHSGSFVAGRRAEGRTRWYHAVVLPGGGIRETPVEFRGLPAGFSADRVVPHPTEDGQFYFSAGGALFLQGRASVPLAIAEQVHSFAVSRDHLYFVTRNGFFAESDLLGGNTKLLGRKGLLLDDASPARIIIGPDGDVAVFDAVSGLFIYRPGRAQELELIAGGVLGIDFAEIGDRLLFWDDSRLWIYWLKDNPAQPFDIAGSKKQIFTSDKAIRLAYLNAEGTHAFYATPQDIRMAEIDDRASVNTYDLVKAEAGSFAMDRRDLTLYWFQNPTLYRAGVR